MWRDRTVSVILPTYNEKDSIRESIEAFLATQLVDEVLVINNNAAPGTSEEVRRTRAREIHETRQGYGAAIRRGLKEATGDLLVVCEPDGTFCPDDLVKFLAYADDCDAVYGTRTVRVLIWRGANMGLFLKWGNWAVAKLAEAIFNTEHLSDVGCTFRLIRRESMQPLLAHYAIDGSAFGLEMMMWSIVAGHRMVQIPVNYRSRVGVSAVTGDFWKAFRLGCWMIGLILRFRLAAGRLRRALGVPASQVSPEP